MKLHTYPNKTLLDSWSARLPFGLLFVVAALASLKLCYGIIPAAVLVLTEASASLAFWSLSHNRPGNFNLGPQPKRWGVLVTSGPYRWIRHPMVTALLLGTAALAVMSGTLFGWVLWLVLAFVLFMNSFLEERWMREQHPDYRVYALTSKRFLPWVY